MRYAVGLYADDKLEVQAQATGFVGTSVDCGQSAGGFGSAMLRLKKLPS